MDKGLAKNITVIVGALAVVLGAFGAHGLKAVLQEPQLEVWKTGVWYHFVHVMAMFILVFSGHFPQKVVRQSFILFLIGILCFSGSLYLLACRDVLGIGQLTILGPITPIGGLFFIAAWLNLIRLKL